MLRAARLPVLFLLVGVAAGCVTLKRTPEARFFVLRPAFEADAAVDEPSGGAVGIHEVRLPGHLQRPQVVTETESHEVRIDEMVRWAEPLEPAMGRVIAENLTALLPDRHILQSPWPARARLLCRVVIDIEAFAPSTSGEVRLEGRWALLGPDQSTRPLALRAFALGGGPVPVGADAVVDARAGAAAMSDLLGQLSRQIAVAIGNLPEPVPEEQIEEEAVPPSS
jgi:uncharacterized lipoprotein YmbA